MIDGHYDDLETAASLADPGCAAKQCSAAELAAQDRFDWSTHLHPTDADRVAALPSSTSVQARGRVDDVPAQPGLYTVTLFWNETIGAEDAEQFLSMNVALEIPQ